MSATSITACGCPDGTLFDPACEAGGAAIQTTLVDLVLTACEWSDDQTEIADLVDVLVASGDVHLVPVSGREPAAG